MRYLTEKKGQPNWTIGLLAIVLLLTVTPKWGKYPVLAQIDPPNPFELPFEDPLKPPSARSLTPLEQLTLKEKLDQLDNEAQAQSEQGNDDVAFGIWYRSLRLRRYLGVAQEVEALGKVGDVAWNKNRTLDVKYIHSRLLTLQKQAETKKTLTPELLETFAGAYQQLRKIDDSLYIQQKILANAKARGDQEGEIKALNAIGELHLSRFDYGSAAPVYEQLLDISQAQQDAYQEGIYLQKLSKIYQESLQPENSVKIKERLAENYLQNQQIKAIPDLKIQIGEDYEALNQLEKASQTYQEAYSLAWALQQFGAAGQALEKLGDLYRKYNQEEYALQIYQVLVKVQQQGYNYYGLMTAYDRIGEVYLKQNNYRQALAAFSQGLELARSISYQEDYFLTKINDVNQKMNPVRPELQIPGLLPVP